MRRGTSCLASGRPLHRLVIHSSAVSLSKFRMLTRWYRIGSSSCSLNNFPLVPNLRLSFRRHFVDFPRSTCAFVPTFQFFRTCGYFLACTYDSLRLFHIYLHDLRNSNCVPSGNDAANRLSESSLALLFLSTWLSFLLIIFANYSACAEGLYFLHCVFTYFALNHVVNDHEL